MQEHINSERVAWRVNIWRSHVAGMSRTKFYKERNAGRIETVKLGNVTLVVTPPQKYIATLMAESRPSRPARHGACGSPRAA
jgi:hypothetical protein